ncbi:hypothetical protein HWV62_36915 [Athelia sp. TMB]|nr:hypothetical protein HWV62_36915 [Athelia sp. TMB]
MSGNSNAAVVAGSIISFSEQVTRQNQEDVKYSTLLAQLASDKRYDRTSQTNEWLRSFFDILQNVGWLSSSPGLSQVDNPAQFGTVDNAVLSILKNNLSPSDLELFQSTVQAFKKDQAAISLFDASAKSGSAATFYGGVVVVDNSGNPTFNISYYNYTTSSKITNTFFNSLTGGQVSFYVGNQTMVLNNAIYNQVRQAVLDKVGSYADRIKDIQL